MNPEGPSVLVGPLAPLESLETVNQKRGPGLMHAQTHADIVRVLVEILVTLIDGALLHGFLNDCLLHSLPELIKGVLTLQSLTKSGLHKLNPSLSFNLLLFAFFLLLFLCSQRWLRLQLHHFPIDIALLLLNSLFLLQSGLGRLNHRRCLKSKGGKFSKLL